MTVRRFVPPVLATGLLAAAFLLPFGSSLGSNANAVATSAAPTTGYTVTINSQGLCDLNSIDLATGTLTDLAASSSEAACAYDLAVAPNGTVYGITGYRFFSSQSADPSGDSVTGGELITFSANGTPTGTSLTIDGSPISGLNKGSIAVDAAGTVYVIAINETTCNTSLNNDQDYGTSDSIAFSCLFSVNVSTGALTQIGDKFADRTPVWGLTSCAQSMWTISNALQVGSLTNEPASLALPWVAVNPTNAALSEGGVSTSFLGFDCLATGNTAYALESPTFGSTSLSLGPAVIAETEHTLGTVDPATGIFTPTVDLSRNVALNAFTAFAVAPLPPEPASTTAPSTTVLVEPVAPTFTH